MTHHSSRSRTVTLALCVVFLAACASTPSTSQPTASPTPTIVSTSTPVVSPTPAMTPTWTPVPQSSLSLRSWASRRGFYVGAATATGYLFSNQPYMETVAREFNMLTPETEMKFDSLLPARGEYHFESADKLVAFAQANGMQVRGHVLVWHRALPDWFLKAKFSRQEAMDFLHDYIKTVVGHFAGRVKVWDVVNEAIYDQGGLRKSVWLDLIGQDYVELAFRWAHEADPNALLFYNDYDIESLGTKSNAAYALLKQLKSQGVPIDGVGMEMHLRGDAPPPSASVRENMRRFADLGLQIQITEMDVSTFYLKGTPDDQLRLQAEVYRSMLETCLSVSKCGALITWGVTDQITWLHVFYGAADRPLLFDEQYRPKPAYMALIAVFAADAGR